MDRLLARAEAMGLRVLYRDLGRNGGYLFGGGLIVLNTRHGIPAQRVTLAHECGHFFYRHDWTQAHDRERDEREADTYAARLLIDFDSYAGAERLVGPHLGAMARELGVTVRLVELYRADLERDARRFRVVDEWRDEWAS